MLSKIHRLKKDKEIKAVFANSKGVFDGACGIKYSQNNLDVSRFAFVVGTKTHKSAVQRNLLKRQYRHIVKDMIPRIAKGFDIVLLIGKDSVGLEFSKKMARLQAIFEKGKLLSDEKNI